MRVIIVGEKNGKAVIRWPQYIGLSFTLSMLVGLGTGGVFRLLAGSWSHMATLWGCAMGLGIAGVGLMNGMRTPPEKLTPLD